MVLTCVLAVAATASRAQQPTPQTPISNRPDSSLLLREPVNRMSLAEFLAQVGHRNLDYAAQAFNVPIAQAQVEVAQLYPNPTIAGGVDLPGKNQATSYDLSLTQTILLGEKRKSRTAVARDQREAARAQLDDFLRTLRGTAAMAYVDALHAEQVYVRKQRTAEDLDRLVALNDRRVKAGDLGEIDLAQSRVDAAQFHGELVSAGNDVRAARLALAALLSPQQTDTLIAPAAPADLLTLPGGPDVPIPPGPLAAAPRQPVAGEIDTLPGGLRAPPPSVALAGVSPGAQQGLPSLDSLTRVAVAGRPDVVAARRLEDAAIAGVKVAEGNRWSDVDVSVGTSYNTLGTNSIDPTPVFGSINFGLSLPIPLSNFSHGELDGARYTAQQADKARQSAEWKAAIDVRQAWSAYQAAVVQLAQYTGGVLLDAERVRRAKLYSYQHGSASLLDVLTAEQAANDVYIASYDAQQQYGHALIGLGQATGTWSLVYNTGP
jgi:outer membrane protein, heavy metal efflux system